MDENSSKQKEVLQTKGTNEYDSAGVKSSQNEDERLQMVLNRDKMPAKMDESVKLPSLQR